MAAHPTSGFRLLRRSPWAFALALCLSVAHARPKEDELRLEVARQWTEKGEYDKAVQELRLYLNEHPDSPEIYARIGGLRMKQGNFKLAGENYKIALAKNPDLAEAREGLANAYERAGDKAKAEEERKKLRAPAKNPKAGEIPPVPPKSAKAAEHPLPKEAISKEAASKEAVPKDIASAETLYSPALDSGASKGAEGIYAQKEFLEALGLYRENKIDAMAGALRRSLAKNPGHPGAYYLGGVMRYEKGEYGKALFNFKRSTAYPDRGFNAYFYMGRIYQRQGRLPEAIAAFEKYLTLTQSEPGRKQAEAYLAQMRGNVPAPKPPAEAKARAADSAAKEGAKPGAHGQPAPGGEGETREAHPPAPKTPAEEAKALVLGRDGSFFFLIPDHASPSGKKLSEAYDLCKKEKYEKAVGTLKEAVLNYGGSDNAAAANLDLASVYLRLGLWENARDRISDYLGSASGDSAKYRDAAHYLSALANLGLKDGDKAEKELLKIKPGTGTGAGPDGRNPSTGPSREEIDYRLAQAGELLQDSKKWSGYLERAHASAKDPARKAILAQQLGFLYSKYGNPDRAMEYFRKSMADCKDSSLAEICAESRLRLADMTFRKKDWKEAMNQYRQFAAKYPDHKESAWVHYQMANIYKSTNNFESALNEYKRVIDNYPDSYWSSQAKWKREDTIWQKEYEEVLD
ncbi:MAG TPA: tetratricopeptide repeat protein [Fibrobacteria bacterium]|nr:tetratricopeptide repeat protein [Fibrobacteria bacterium]